MANYGPMELYVCCDSVSNNTTISFLNSTECVPFRDQTYDPTIARYRYGNLEIVSCDSDDIYADFQYPRKIEKGDDQYGDFFLYECCKSESVKFGPYIQDSVFKKSVYPQIVLSSVAILLCLLLIVALLIPLFLHLKKKREQISNEINNTNTNSSTARTTTRTRTNNNTNPRRGQQNTVVPAYGSYDLYLAYLALPDLMMNIILLITFGNKVNQKVPNTAYVCAVVMACTTANLYINCVISYEILNLLRNSKNVARSRPPSLIKVTIQAMVVYIFSILVFVAYYFTHKAQIQARTTGDIEKDHFLMKVNLSWGMTVSFAIPIIYFCYVWITIWYRGYFNMSSVTGVMKELAWYFFRIFAIFNLIWLPGVFLTIFGGEQGPDYRNLVTIGYLFAGIQPIVSFFFAMMKTDVRKYTINLLTLSYIQKVPESTPTAVNDELE